jgi:hypothetical protein
MEDIIKAFGQFESGIRQSFGREKQLDFFLHQMKMAFAFAQSSFELRTFNAGKASMILQLSKRKKQEVLFGFVAWSDEQEDQKRLWEDVKNFCKEEGISKIKGPIQGATYFPYQVVSQSKGQAFFKGEFFSAPEEHEWYMSLEPAVVNYYRSAYRDHFDRIMEVSKPYYDQLKPKGLEYLAHQKVDRAIFKNLLELVNEIFGSNWSFTHLGPEAFEQIFAEEAAQGKRLSLHEIKLKDDLIGFIRYIENDEETLICKTMGLKPSFQKMGIGNASVYEMHREALRQDYKKMIYALVYTGNRVQNMPDDDAIIFRHYASYEYLL